MAFGGAVIGTASLGFYYADQPKQIEYDIEGNQMFLMQLDSSSSFLNMEATYVKEGELVSWKKAMFPKQFWTKWTARGEETYVGTEEGYDRLVFKGVNGKYLGVGGEYYELIADKDRAGLYEKFNPHFVSDNVVALQSPYGGYVSCKQQGLFAQGGTFADAQKITDKEEFYVYETSACGKSWDTPDTGSDCIAFKNKRTGLWLTLDNSPGSKMVNYNVDVVKCDGKRAGEKQKWYGWREPIEWTVDSRVSKIVGSWALVSSGSQSVEQTFGTSISKSEGGELGHQERKDYSKSISASIGFPVFLATGNAQVSLTKRMGETICQYTTKEVSHGYSSSTSASCKTDANKRAYVYQWQQDVIGENMDSLEMKTPHFTCIYDSKIEPLCPPNDCANSECTKCVDCLECEGKASYFLE